ncbi:DUF645 family protein [Vibrio cholerae]|nr:DUF645 family protein [Vibrio cholerae]EJL6267980.1 DUF645 family protein [Vibrio cholerae]EJL6282276.1 DUF645 family protein [Vibrio cholerae]EJL6409322.1 DUF645 family protein [Vibrio cholerae]EJL6710249.1 DUF645 family protein [Vibrio cholerae]
MVLDVCLFDAFA